MPRLWLIVKGDDRSVACIVPHVSDNLTGIEAVGIIACDKIPEYETVFLLQDMRVSPSEPAVRRPEQFAVDKHICFLDIGKVCFGTIGESRDMVHGMIANTMSACLDLLEDSPVAGYIITHTEESSLDAITVENIEHPRRNLGRRSVIECQIDALWLRWKPPKCARCHYDASQCGWLLDEHGKEYNRLN